MYISLQNICCAALNLSLFNKLSPSVSSTFRNPIALQSHHKQRISTFSMVTIKLLLTFSLLAHLTLLTSCQRTYLLADGNSTGTYTLINSLYGGTAVEVPDCNHPQMHITQVNDTQLNVPVFKFDSHVDTDNDRCINMDRLRTEIKTHNPSPVHMKGFEGDDVSFSWDMKLGSDTGFQPSATFTHVYQIKPVGGDESQPILTITPRLKDDGRRVLQVIHCGLNSQPNTIWEGDLTLFAGQWVHIVTEYSCRVTGRYHMRITRKDNNALLMTYTNSLQMWRPGNTFSRPKWGIYRSLNDRNKLRDEEVFFNNFCIGKGDIYCN